MSHPIPSLPEFLMNTTEPDFLGAVKNDFYRSSELRTSPAPLVLVQGGDSTRLSKNGKMPRIVSSAKRERENTSFRSRMQEARVELGVEFYNDGLKTLASLRLARGYSQQQLAAAVGSTQPHIAKIEAGFTNIYLATAKSIAKALGVTLDEFYALLHTEADLVG